MKNKTIKQFVIFIPIFLVLILALLNDAYSMSWIEPNIYIWLDIYLIAISVVQVCIIIKQQYTIVLLFFKHIIVFLACLIVGLLCFSVTGGVSFRLGFAAMLNFLVSIISIILLIWEFRISKNKQD